MDSEDKISALGGQYSILMETSGDRLQGDINSVVEDLRGGGMAGVYVSINKPYETVNNILKGNGIDIEGMFFIDCISGVEGRGSGNVSFIPNISDLGGLSIEITRVIDKIPGRKFLLIDAIHTLWIYHTPEFIARFIQNMAERSYRADVMMVTFIVESEDRRLLRKLVPLVDFMIQLQVRK
jgi:KaiC/GvpD/RAD55 family RecA-like ATPase